MRRKQLPYPLTADWLEGYGIKVPSNISSFEEVLDSGVSIDISWTAVEAAFKKCPTANLLCVSPVDYFHAREIVTQLAKEGRSMYFLKCRQLPDDCWLLGDLTKPDSFIGSSW